MARALVALLRRIAAAGYQNPDETREFAGELKRVMHGDSSIAVNVKEGLSDLAERFKSAGEGTAVDSWRDKGANTEINEKQLETALGSDLVDDLVDQSELSRETLLSLLARVLPEAVDELTPEGRIPT